MIHPKWSTKYTCVCVKPPCNSAALISIRHSNKQRRWQSFFVFTNTITRSLNFLCIKAGEKWEIILKKIYILILMNPQKNSLPPKIASRFLSVESRNLTNSCLSLGVTSIFSLRKIFTGRFNAIRTRSSTLSVIVAENNRVWRFLEHNRMTSLSCSKKHSSKRRSASSRMIISTVSRLKHGVLCKWSMRRPGVAMQMSGPSRSEASCDLISKPPLF